MKRSGWPGEYAVLAGCFVLLQLFAIFVLNLRFDAAPLTQDYVQFLSIERLRHHCFESLWYLHSQPPLFNAALCAMIKAPWPIEVSGEVLWRSVGLLYASGLYWLVRRRGLSPKIALALTLGFVGQPGFLFYESWLFYTLPVAAALLGFAVLIEADAAGIGRWGLPLAFSLLGAVVLTHGLYHVGFYALVWAVAAWCHAHRRRVLYAGLPAAALIVGVVLKNWFAVGTLTMSSGLLGMQIANTTLTAIKPAWRDRVLNAAQRDFVATPLYLSIDHYLSAPELDSLRTGHSLLDESFMDATLRTRNFNHVGYFTLNPKYQAIGLRLLAQYPGKYLGYVLTKVRRQLFLPIGEHAPFVGAESSNPGLGIWSRVYSVLYLRPPRGPSLAIAFAVVWLGYRTVEVTRRPRAILRKGSTEIFMLMAIGYTLALTIFVTAEELNRYRFYVDAFILLFALDCPWPKAMYLRLSKHLPTLFSPRPPSRA